MVLCSKDRWKKKTKNTHTQIGREKTKQKHLGPQRKGVEKNEVLLRKSQACIFFLLNIILFLLLISTLNCLHIAGCPTPIFCNKFSKTESLSTRKKKKRKKILNFIFYLFWIFIHWIPFISSPFIFQMYFCFLETYMKSFPVLLGQSAFEEYRKMKQNKKNPKQLLA